MASTPPGQRRQQILVALAEMLEQPKGEKITTAALARKLEFSEAALYRHFASKAQMFEGLIDFIETGVFGVINQIMEKQTSGVAQVRDIVGMLLQFSASNPGMTRVLTGDALVGEDERLQHRMNQLHERIELALRQALRLATTEGYGHDDDIGARAGVLLAYVIGRWHRYAKSGFKLDPTQDTALHIALLM
ncbi:MAG: nucleoid occlusion factor SlmA [Burkholderiaceae bacterium]|nr:nucleoid occlusion factor SlmA [Burkholderiaceae bacterium]